MQPTVPAQSNDNGANVESAILSVASAITNRNRSKIDAVRQNNTTASENLNSRILTGWGVITATATSVLSEAVIFKDSAGATITFQEIPIVIAVSGGDSLNPGSSTYGAGGALRNNFYVEAISITQTGFTARCISGVAWVAGDTVFYQWLAVGIY